MIAPAAPVTVEQIRAIKAMARQLRLSDDDYRAMLAATTGKRSAKDLSTVEAGRVIEKLKPLAGPGKPAAKGAQKLTGEYAAVCRVLWIAAYNLGLVEIGTDKALVAFVKRQTGIAHLNWLHDPADAGKVIEALKGWMVRDRAVIWNCTQKQLKAQGLSLARWRKLMVLRAQHRHLVGLGEHDPLPDTHHMGDADLDQLSSRLGRQIREAQRRRTARLAKRAGAA